MKSKQTPASNTARSVNSGSARIDTTQPNRTEDTAEARWRRTAIAAFYRAQARGFTPGRELEDWLEAEREVDSLDTEVPETAISQSAAPADDRKQTEDRATPERKQATSKRARTTRGASLQARKRGDES